MHLMQGVDFFFSKRSHAQRFLDFLQGVVPLRYRTDKQLVSHNEQNATYNYKYTFSVEIVPICKVIIPKPLLVPVSEALLSSNHDVANVLASCQWHFWNCNSLMCMLSMRDDRHLHWWSILYCMVPPGAYSATPFG